MEFGLDGWAITFSRNKRLFDGDLQRFHFYLFNFGNSHRNTFLETPKTSILMQTNGPMGVSCKKFH